MIKLSERTIDFGKIYDQYFQISGNTSYGKEHFSNTDDAKEVFALAKARAEGKDKSKEAEEALFYIYKIARPMALKYFWVFLGPNTRSQQARINNGDDVEYLSLCTEAIYKALNAFNPDKGNSTAELKTGFQYYFRGYIKAATEKYNRNYASHGLDSDDVQVISPDSYENDGNNSAWDTLDYENEYNQENDLLDSLDNDNFIDTWKALSNDKELRKPGKYWNEMLASILKGNSVEDVAKEFGVAKNTVREKFYSTKHNRENGSDGLLSDLLKKYNINIEDLAKNLKNNQAFIINTLLK